MICRPVDESGDILPVLSASALLSGPAALAAGLRDHLNLFPGDWWERTDAGNPLLDLIILSRRTAQDAETLSAALLSYLQSFPGVLSVTDVQAGFSGHRFSFSCVAHAGDGTSADVSFVTET